MLDDGRYGSVTELAVEEKLDRGYLGKILMLMRIPTQTSRCFRRKA